MKIHTQIKDKLNMMIINKKIPHIIFHGPSGSGKRQLLEEFMEYEQKSQFISTGHTIFRDSKSFSRAFRGRI